MIKKNHLSVYSGGLQMQKALPATVPAKMLAIGRQQRSWSLLLVGVFVLAAGAIAFLQRRPLTVSVAGVERAVAIKVYGLGSIEARILSEIGFEVGAALSELRADHGDHVAKGTVLAHLHSAEQEAKVAKARAGVVNADAALKVAEAAVGRAQAILAQKEAVNRRKQALLGRQITSIEAAGEAEKEEVVAHADVAISGGKHCGRQSASRRCHAPNTTTRRCCWIIMC